MLAEQDPIPWPAAIALMVIVGVVLVGSGWLVIEVARRTADGRLGPNGWAGTRTKATRSSPEAWQAAHKAGLDRTLQGGWACIATGVLSIPIGLALGGDDANRATTVWGVAVGVGSLILTILIVMGAVQSQAAAKRFGDAPSD